MWHRDVVIELMVGFSHSSSFVVHCTWQCARTIVLFSFLGIGNSVSVHDLQAVVVRYV